MIPKYRKPTIPGEVLLKEFLEPLGLTQVKLAKRMNVPVQRINTIINGRRDMTAETAVLLSRALNTSVEFWMNLQTACDIYKAEKELELV
jgi:antitoxin HigA-1